MALFTSGAIVATVIGGLALVIIGRPLLTGEAFNAVPPANVRQATPTTVTLMTSADFPATQGTPMALTATVTPAAVGTVQFKDGITNLGSPVRVSNGTAFASKFPLAPGSHSLIAVFTPSDPAAYAASTSPAVVFTVTAAPATSTTLMASPASSAVQGIPVTLTATITPATATGTVQFKDGANNIGNPVPVSNGVAAGSTSSLIAGPHQLIAVFTPTDPTAFSPSTSSPLTFTITPPAGPVATNTVLTASPESSAGQGSPVTLTATVIPAVATGTVQFRDGTRNLGNPVVVSNGMASGSTSTLPAGSRSLIAVFTSSNPALFSSSTSPTVAFTITGSTTSTMRAATTSTALITSPASPVRRGTQVALIATVSPANAAGTVQFRDGVINLGNPVVVSNGSASTTVSRFGVGGHQLTAVFTPADPAAFAASTSPVLAFEVTDPGVADLMTCLRVLQNCPTPRADTFRLVVGHNRYTFNLQRVAHQLRTDVIWGVAHDGNHGDGKLGRTGLLDTAQAIGNGDMMFFGKQRMRDSQIVRLPLLRGFTVTLVTITVTVPEHVK